MLLLSPQEYMKVYYTITLLDLIGILRGHYLNYIKIVKVFKLNVIFQ